MWGTVKQMSEIFECATQNIEYHRDEIFKIGELNLSSVTKEFLVTASDGKKYNTKHYNLDMLISVGYRVNSVRAVQFRKWATKILKEYICRC